MSAPAPSRRTVGLILGAVLVIVGAVIAAFAVFGGSTEPDPDPTPSSSSQPTDAPPTNEPTGNPTCPIFDAECQAGGGDGGTGGTTPQPSSPPDGGEGGNGGNGGLFGGTG
ncbi:hypothetical protein [Streptomyces sp. ISL-100]|uniref:hypothetical protein n=1 Tax=Streptomyces sp. ISL-100 TaxID=2819173 RepID=UPI001BE61C07|nr:hypothetical protein [Streptomyces sp. ISL-100]MBT2396281.1 hypothetical protein [Streptomyces sp. ISL-100]